MDEYRLPQECVRLPEQPSQAHLLLMDDDPIPNEQFAHQVRRTLRVEVQLESLHLSQDPILRHSARDL